MNFKTLLLLSFLFFSQSLTTHAQDFTFTNSNNGANQNITAGTSQTYELKCPLGLSIKEFELSMDASGGTSNTFGVYIAGVHIGTSTVSASDNFLFGTNNFTGVSYACISATSTVKVINASANAIQIGGLNGGFAQPLYQNYINTSNYIYFRTTPDTNNRFLSAKIKYAIPSSGGNVYVPVDTELSSLQCITNAPTSTCSFEYSTTTATSTTIDYSPQLNLFLIFIGLLSFAYGIYCFRSLAHKYL